MYFKKYKKKKHLKKKIFQINTIKNIIKNRHNDIKVNL